MPCRVLKLFDKSKETTELPRMTRLSANSRLGREFRLEKAVIW
jgi:hypothetical protein